jgi:hypothetical protein
LEPNVFCFFVYRKHRHFPEKLSWEIIIFPGGPREDGVFSPGVSLATAPAALAAGNLSCLTMAQLWPRAMATASIMWLTRDAAQGLTDVEELGPM